MKEVGYNKRANFDYEISEKFEAGLILTGSEVKSLRMAKANMSDCYAGFGTDGQIYVYNIYIPEYKMSNDRHYEPKRMRKLLLHKKEISKLSGVLNRGGITLVPISMYFCRTGFVKLCIGIGKGKKNVDKRETIKEREWNREKSRILRRGDL